MRPHILTLSLLGLGFFAAACGGDSSVEPLDGLNPAGDGDGDVAGPRTICGDGVQEGREECDDGNNLSGDGCSPGCALDPGYACQGSVCTTQCGDGIVGGQEVCDGNSSPTGPCAADCTGFVSMCGNGIAEPQYGETCDILPEEEGLGGAMNVPNISQGAIGCDSCQTALGFVCNPDTNHCQQTGVDRDELINDHVYEFCVALNSMWGGTGHTFTCGISEYTVLPIPECQSNIQGEYRADCTVGEIEDWMLGKTPCQMINTLSPCD